MVEADEINISSALGRKAPVVTPFACEQWKAVYFYVEFTIESDHVRQHFMYMYEKYMISASLIP